MYKSYIVALREYRAAVRSKAFVITLVAMPILMGGAIVGQLLLKDQVDTKNKNFVIVDRSGQFDSFDRIAYLVELDSPGGKAEKVFVSMDAFTDDATKIGIPTASSGAEFRQLRSRGVAG